MEVDQSVNLLDLPSQILEKIVDFLPFLAVRKNLRLTCRELYDLCNLEHFCRDEVINWCNCVRCRRQIIADFSKSSRGCYNLKFSSMNVKSHEVSPFFQQFGAKVQFLHFEKITSSRNLLETITSYCGGLVSLTCDNSFSFYDPKFVPLPSVTSIVLHMKYISAHSSILIPSFFHQMPYIFPCVKHLKITLRIDRDERWYSCGRSKGCVWNLASNFRHLESLNLHMSMNELIAEVPPFPKLKNLSLHLDGNCYIFSGPFEQEEFSDVIKSSWPVFISRFMEVNTFSIEISGIGDLSLSDIMPSLSGVGLERLTLHSWGGMQFNIDDFEALVSSRSKIMCFNVKPIAQWTEQVTENWALETNKTLTDLEVGSGFDLSLMMLFCTYFHGLVHLETYVVDDDILQTIFKYQKNLRSLILSGSEECSIEGFCGGEDSPYENTITDLQKLEELQIGVDAEVIQSDRFQTAFRFPLLRYLRLLTSSWNNDNEREATELEIPVNLLKSCTNLAAVNLSGFKNPSSTIISSLIQNLKYLNYVNVGGGRSDQPDQFHFTYVNFNQFYWIDSAKLLSEFVPGSFYYDQVLDQTVFTSKRGRSIQIHTPKISSKTVDWITVCAGEE